MYTNLNSIDAVIKKQKSFIEFIGFLIEGQLSQPKQSLEQYETVDSYGIILIWVIHDHIYVAFLIPLLQNNRFFPLLN